MGAYCPTKDEDYLNKLAPSTTSPAVYVDFLSTVWKRCAHFLADRQGGALVEFAMVLPPLLMVLTAVFSLGIATNNELELTQAVGSGAQYLQALRGNTTDPCAAVFSQIKVAAPNLKSSNINLTVTMSGTAVNATTCSGDQTDLVAGGSITVAATYPCNLFIYGLNLGTGCKLSAQTTEYEY